MSNKALDHKCPACRAVIKWNPKLQKFKCEFCDNEYSLDQLKDYENASTVENNQGEKGDDTEYDSYKCKDCGAEIIADKDTSATFCVYCGNTAILKNKLSGKFSPKYIIPFKTTKELAIEKFKGLRKVGPLVPKEFVNANNIEKIRGLYVPFWVYDVKIEGTISVDAKRITSWSDSTCTYTKTDTYDAVRGGKMVFNQIPADGSSYFDDNIMSSLEPFNFKELKEYNHAYLSGFLAERYDVNDQETFKRVNDRAKTAMTNELYENVVGYQSKMIKSNNLSTYIIKADYILLPVWMVNVKYKEKFYTFAMNGQTGEFIGNIPLDKNKTVMYSVLIFIVMFIMSFVVTYVISQG